MKFDLVISNPPYNRGLDLKILNEIYPLGEKIVFVHPATWIIDNKNRNKLFKKTRELVKDDISYYEIFDGNGIFPITVFYYLAITFFDKKKKSKVNISEIDIHGKSKIYKNLKKKILNFCETSNVWDNVKTKNKKTWELGVGKIRGHPRTSDEYSILRKKDQHLHVGKSTKYPYKFIFDTEKEVHNFKDYLKTKFARFALSIFKMNGNYARGEMRSIPYMPTYEKNWTDEQAAQEVGLTDEELQFMLDWIPNYYPEDEKKYGQDKQKI